MHLNFSSLFIKSSTLHFQKFFHSSSFFRTSHYDTLNLKKNCTPKDIRDSFIKLSKQHHPDINKSPEAHKKFLKIQEAYKVLSKPSIRACYDLDLEIGQTSYHSDSTTKSYRTYYTEGEQYYSPGRNPWDDPSFYHNRDKSQDAENAKAPYYGIKGIQRQSNGRVAFFIVFCAATIFTIQMIIIQRMILKQQAMMDKQSKMTQQVLNEVKEKAERNGNQKQLELHRQQFEEMDRIRAEHSTKWT